MRGLALALWLVFAALLFGGGYVLLHACAFRLPWLPDMCPATAEVGALDQAAQRRDGLERERDRLMQVANLAPQCTITAEARPPEPERPVRLTVCQPPPTDEVLLLIDASPSMGWDFSADPQLMQQMNDLWQGYLTARKQGRTVDAARLQRDYERIVRQLNAGPGPDRIDLARQALNTLGQSMPPNTKLNLVSFAECGRPPQREGIYDRSSLDAYRRAVNTLRLRSSTALAEAITALPRYTQAGRSPDRPVNIVILSDGGDSCDGDPCAAARQLRQEMPYASVSVVAMAAEGNANACVAEATGGHFYTAQDMEDLIRRLRQATGQLSEAECEALGPPAAEGETQE